MESAANPKKQEEEKEDSYGDMPELEDDNGNEDLGSNAEQFRAALMALRTMRSPFYPGSHLSSAYLQAVMDTERMFFGIPRMSMPGPAWRFPTTAPADQETEELLAASRKLRKEMQESYDLQAAEFDVVLERLRQLSESTIINAKRIEDLKSERDALKEQVRKLKEAPKPEEDHDVCKDELKAKLGEGKKQCQHQCNENTKATGVDLVMITIEAFKKEAAGERALAQQYEERVKSLTAENIRLTSKCSKHEEQLRACTEKLLADFNKERNALVKAHRDESYAHSVDVENSCAIVRNAERACSELAANKDHIINLLNKRDEKIKELDAQLQARLDETKELRSKIEHAEKERASSLDSQRDRLLNGVQAEIAPLRQTIVELNTNRQIAIGKLVEMADRNDQLTKKNAELSAQLEKLTGDVVTLEAEKEKLIAANRALECHAEKHDADLGYVTRRAETLADECDELKKLLKEEQAKHSEQAAECERLSALCGYHRVEREKEMQEANLANKRLEELKALVVEYGKALEDKDRVIQAQAEKLAKFTPDPPTTIASATLAKEETSEENRAMEKAAELGKRLGQPCYHVAIGSPLGKHLIKIYSDIQLNRCGDYLIVPSDAHDRHIGECEY